MTTTKTKKSPARPAEAGDNEPREMLLHVPIDDIGECPHNPRRHFDPERQAELVASVREHGIITPVLVRHDGKRAPYELAAGHRRLRAAREAGLTLVPAIVRWMDDRQFAEVLNLENLQREDLDELDEAEGFRQLRDLAGYDVPAIALKLSRSEKYVYDRLKLLELVPAAQDLLRAGRITAGHAILIARLSAEDQARAIDPDPYIGGLWQHEEPTADGLFDEDDQERLDDPLAGFKVVTVRELDAWINAHVRLDRDRLDPVYDPQAHSLFAGLEAAEREATEEVPKVVPITRLTKVPPAARGDVGTLCVSSWKRADGEVDSAAFSSKPSKRCDHSVKGVVVVGPGRGEVFDICTAKKKCRVHWAAELKAANQRSAANSSTTSPAGPTAAEKREANRRAKEERETKARKQAAPEIWKAIDDAIAKAPCTPGGVLHRMILGEWGFKQAKLTGTTADDLVRGIAAWMFRQEVNEQLEWLGAAEAELIKDLGVDLDAIVQAHLKAEPKVEKAVKKAGVRGKPKAPAGRRAGRARAQLPMLVTLVALLLGAALSGCNGPAWARVASTVELGAGRTDYGADDALGNPIYADSTAVWVSVRPLAFLEPPTKVVVVQGAAGDGK